MHNYPAIVEALITKGAFVNIKNKDGYTVLKLARLSGQTEIMELLKQSGAKE